MDYREEDLSVYQYIEAIKDELQMIDVRAANYKFYNTIRTPAWFRRLVKSYLKKKCLKSIKKHLESKPAIDFNYAKDLSNFINTGIDMPYMNMYRLLKNNIFYALSNPDKATLKFIKTENSKNITYTIDFYKDGHIQVTTVTPSKRDDKINTVHTDYYIKYLPSEINDLILDMTYKYVSYYLSLSCMETKDL